MIKEECGAIFMNPGVGVRPLLFLALNYYFFGVLINLSGISDDLWIWSTLDKFANGEKVFLLQKLETVIAP